MGSPAARLFWAWNLGDLNLLISDQVTAQTKLLLHRSLADRLGTLAPFLALDGNPYLVVAPDGHLVYVQDAYTISGRDARRHVRARTPRSARPTTTSATA